MRCPRCGHTIEELDFVDPGKRVTKRLAQYILSLCPYLTIKEIAKHLHLDWKTVKAIHKEHLQARFSQGVEENPHLLAVDEISVKKRHHSLTVILNWETGRTVWVGKERKYETLKEYFASLSEEQKGSIEAIAIDTRDPSIKAVKECCPEASIVFREFHMVKAFERMIDRVRRQEYHQTTSEGKEVIKGSKYLLLKNIITECQAPLS